MAEPVPDYIEITAANLTMGNRTLKPGDLVAVAEIGEGTAAQLITAKRAKPASKAKAKEAAEADQAAGNG